MLYINAKPGDKLNLGRKGENLARTILFDISQWRKLYGDGVVALLHQRAGDANPYPCDIETDGNTVAWAITAADTAVASQYGKYELQYRVNDQLAKSATGAASVYESLGESTAEPPEAQQGWVDQVLKAGANASASASAAAQSEAAAAEYAEQAQSAADQAEMAANRAESVGTSVELDTTLTQRGKAADAKATGEALEKMIPAPDTAAVGQTIVVKAVDENGKPVEWEAADMVSGAGGITETARNLLFTILRAAYYSSDQTSNIDALMAALMPSGDSSGGESGGDSGDDGSGDSTDAVIEQIGSVLKIVSGVTVAQQGATLTIR